MKTHHVPEKRVISHIGMRHITRMNDAYHCIARETQMSLVCRKRALYFRTFFLLQQSLAFPPRHSSRVWWHDYGRFVGSLNW